MNKKHLRDEIEGLQIIGPGEAIHLGNPMRFIATVSEIVNREGVPGHFAKDLERVKDENYLLDQARISANAKHGHQYMSHQLGPFIVQEHGFLRINYCAAILEGIKQWAESDPSFRLMKHHDYLQENFEAAIRSGGTEWTNWIANFQTLWEEEILPGYPHFHEKLGKFFNEAQELFKLCESPLNAKKKAEASKKGVALLGEIYKFFYRFCLGVTPSPVPAMGNGETTSAQKTSQSHGKEKIDSEDKFFHFGNSVTNFQTYRIWKDGHEKNGQTLNEAKRRYIWEFCSICCDKGHRTQAQLDEYVNEKLNNAKERLVHVTTDDMKKLLELLARFSDVPLQDIKKEYIQFREGVGIEVKKVP